MQASYAQEHFDERPVFTLQQACTYYCAYKRAQPEVKRTIKRDEDLLDRLLEESCLGDMPLHEVRRASFDPWVRSMLAKGRRHGTINHPLKVVRQILKLAATHWEDSAGRKWLDTVTPIALLEDKPQDKRQPYPLTWAEQEQLFTLLPEHLRDMALFAVNSGCRDGEVCKLRWSWEQRIDALDTSVFVIPAEFVKNKRKRLVVINSIARDVLERWRDVDEEQVFVYKGKGIKRMNNSAWCSARELAKVPSVRVHDLKHTFGTRLEHAGVHPELKASLLGHTGGKSMTSHYSPQSLQRLIKASESVVGLVDEEDGEAVVLRL